LAAKASHPIAIFLNELIKLEAGAFATL